MWLEFLVLTVAGRQMGTWPAGRGWCVCVTGGEQDGPCLWRGTMTGV